jgi:hypothetical protein
VGSGGFVVELPNYARRLDLPVRRTDSAQNLFFQVGAEFGLVGLLAGLWVFYEIMRRLFSSWRRPASREPPGLLVIGAFAGGASLFVNLLAHPYIRSIEIIYLLWLLVALLILFVPVRRWRPPGVLSSSFVVGLLALASLFGAVHLWNSRRGLSLERTTKEFSLDQSFGLQRRDRDNRGFAFTLTKKTAGITVDNRGRTLVIPLLALHPDIEKNPVTVRISSASPVFRSPQRLQEVVLRDHRWVELEQDLSFLETGSISSKRTEHGSLARSGASALPLRRNPRRRLGQVSSPLKGRGGGENIRPGLGRPVGGKTLDKRSQPDAFSRGR